MYIDLRERYVPFDTQRKFHTDPARFKLFGGAMGGGKSYALAAEGLQLSLDYPGNVGYVGRLDFTDLSRTTYKSFLEIIPQELIDQHNKSEHWIRLKAIGGKKSMIYFGELKDIDSLKSLNLGWFAIDEASEAPEEAFLMLTSRLRLSLPKIKYFGILASNPEPGWVKKRFVDQQLPGYSFIPSLPTDNPYLPEDYEERLKESFPDQWVKRYLEGSWDVFEGQIFPEFNPNEHVIDPFAVDKNWEATVVIDPGFVNPCAATLWVTDYDGNCYCIDEHYVAGQVISWHADQIKRWYTSYNITNELIDPSAQAKVREKNGRMYSVLDEFLDAGLNPVPANNDVLAGINRVRQYFRNGQIKIFKNCVNLIREVPEYQWQKLKPTQLGELNYPEKPRKLNDHAVDTMRYFIMSRPDPSMTKEQKQKREYTSLDTGIDTLGEDMLEEEVNYYEDVEEI